MADDVQPVLTENLKVLLDKARPELKALPEEKIVQRKITPSRVLALTKVMRRSCQRLLGVLDDELAEKRVVERKAQIAGIANRARVFYAADMRAAEIDANPVEVVNDALAVRVKAYDHQLYKWALPTFGDDPVKAAILRDIARGSGKRDDANDVLRLVGMFQDNLKFALTKAPEITEVLLDEAEAAAMQQLEELDSADPNPAKDLAARAYSAWHHDYKLLRRLGFYVFGDLPDVGKRFPGISSGSSRRSAIETPVSIEEFDEDEDEEDLEDGDEEEPEDDLEDEDEEEPEDEPQEPPNP